MLPPTEPLRLEALRPYQVYNTMRDETFVELVRLTARLFGVPIGIIAFVEEEEVRFGLNYGLAPDMDRVNRWETLCSVAMLHEEISVFEDLREYPCALINPMLVQRLNLGFYAGCALRTAGGHSIGVLCVIDHQPRQFSPAEADLLQRLSAAVMSLLDLRLHLLQQPTWNQPLWASVHARIGDAIARLSILADAPAPAARPTALAEMGALVDGLTAHLRAQLG